MLPLSPVKHREPCGCTVHLATTTDRQYVDLELLQVERCPLHQSAEAVLHGLSALMDVMPDPIHQGDYALATAYMQAARALQQARGVDPVANNTYRMYAALRAQQRLADHECTACAKGYHCANRDLLAQRAHAMRTETLASIAALEAAPNAL
jgi:hypothetical protein